MERSDSAAFLLDKQTPPPKHHCSQSHSRMMKHTSDKAETQSAVQQQQSDELPCERLKLSDELWIMIYEQVAADSGAVLRLGETKLASKSALIQTNKKVHKDFKPVLVMK